MEEIAVFTFASVYHALRAEKILHSCGLEGKLISIPRALSSCCQGLGVAVSVEDRQKMEWALLEHGVVFEKNVTLSAEEVFS